jgi:hypothetical protein
MTGLTRDYDLWRALHRDCAADPGPPTVDQARFVLTLHAGHGGHCHQYLGALFRISVVCG